MNRIMCLVALFTILATCSTSTIAADISLVRASIIIEGPIQKGDYLTFEMMLKQGGPTVQAVQLYSPGGDVIEAIKMGKLVRKFYMYTVTGGLVTVGDLQTTFCHRGTELRFSGPLNKEGFEKCGCASACFFVWSAGVSRTGGLLGLHRPYFEPEYFANLGAQEADEMYRELLQQVEDYLLEMDVPKSYYDRMVSLPSNELEILNEEEVKRNLKGDIPSIGEWLAAKCGTFTDKEGEQIGSLAYKKDMLGLSLSSEEQMLWDLLREKSSAYHECRSDALRSERELILQDFFD